MDQAVHLLALDRKQLQCYTLMEKLIQLHIVGSARVVQKKKSLVFKIIPDNVKLLQHELPTGSSLMFNKNNTGMNGVVVD